MKLVGLALGLFISLSLLAQAQDGDLPDLPKPLDVNVSVGAAVSGQNAEAPLAAGTFALGSTFYNPLNTEQQLLPFKIELWFGDQVLDQIQIRKLEANLGSIILGDGFSASLLDVKHKTLGIGESELTTTGFAPVIVNYKHEIAADGKLVFSGYIGAGIAGGIAGEVVDEPFGGMNHLRDEAAGFYMPTGVSIFGESSRIKWAIEADYVYMGSEVDVTKKANPRTKYHNIHSLQMQTLHVGTQVELKLQELLKQKIFRGVTLYARVDFQTVLLVDNLDEVKYSKGRRSYTSEVLSSNTSTLNQFNNVSGQVGIKINFGGKKKKTPNPGL